MQRLLGAAHTAASEHAHFTSSKKFQTLGVNTSPGLMRWTKHMHLTTSWESHSKEGTCVWPECMRCALSARGLYSALLHVLLWGNRLQQALLLLGTWECCTVRMERGSALVHKTTACTYTYSLGCWQPRNPASGLHVRYIQQRCWCGTINEITETPLIRPSVSVLAETCIFSTHEVTTR